MFDDRIAIGDGHFYPNLVKFKLGEKKKSQKKSWKNGWKNENIHPQKDCSRLC